MNINQKKKGGKKREEKKQKQNKTDGIEVLDFNYNIIIIINTMHASPPHIQYSIWYVTNFQPPTSFLTTYLLSILYIQ